MITWLIFSPSNQSLRHFELHRKNKVRNSPVFSEGAVTGPLGEPLALVPESFLRKIRFVNDVQEDSVDCRVGVNEGVSSSSPASFTVILPAVDREFPEVDATIPVIALDEVGGGGGAFPVALFDEKEELLLK